MSVYAFVKVETIGDAYTCASGVPVRNPNHAAELANMALAIRIAVADTKVSKFLDKASLALTYNFKFTYVFE